MADLMIAGRLSHLASSSANSGSSAALFAAPFADSLDFPAESESVRSLSWAYNPPFGGFLFSIQNRRPLHSGQPNPLTEVAYSRAIFTLENHSLSLFSDDEN
jgi:hypothetical protein